MTSTTGHTPDPLGVNHPKHYNVHPSGIECIEIVRCLPFGLGSAVKYLWRAKEKQEYAKDIKKALWYIEDTLENLCPCEEPNDDTAPQTVYMRQLSEVFSRFKDGLRKTDEQHYWANFAIDMICQSVLHDTRIPLERARDNIKDIISTYTL